MNWVYLLCAAGLLVIKAASQSLPTSKYNCSQNVSSLSEMLKVDPQDSNLVICVELESMEEVLQYSNMTVPFSVVIKPAVSGERSTVTCNNSVVLPLTDYYVFPLIFNTSEFVVIENIDFVGCMRPVQILWVKEVTLIDTTFSNFNPAGALEISNSPRIIVDNCQFTNNTSQGIGKTRYSGNSGGMSIGFDGTPRPPEFRSIPPEIFITETQFTNNSANANEAFVYDVSYVLKTNIFNQRGGAMAIYIGSPNYTAQILIQNCTIKGNQALDSGGGIYMNIGGENNNHSIKIIDTNFIENNGPDGGGLEITQYSNVHIDEPHHAVNIINCNFLRNVATFGGGYKSLQIFVYLNTVNLYNCTFINNSAQVGGALYLQSVFTVPLVTLLENSIIEDCTFENNNGNRGILFVIQNSVGIRGNTVFRNNTGPALRILHCLVSLGGEISFLGNHAHPEGFSGALYFSQYGQVLLRRGVSISFINNTGKEGACIVVRRQLLSAGFPQQLYNPQCFLQYEEPVFPPHEWNVTMLFEGNKAQLGPIIFTSDFNPCQWYNREQPFFSLNSSTVWPFMEMRENYIIRGNELILSPEDYVQTEIHSLLIPNITSITASPGTIVTLDAIALDQFNRNTSAFLELLNDQDADDNVVFEPSIAQTVAGSEHISFTYSSQKLLGKTDMILRASFISTEQIPSANLTLIHEPCLPGYILEGDRCECREGTNTVLFCLPDQRGVLLADGLWGAPPSWSRSLVTHTCPSGYCNCTGDREFQESEGCPLFYQDSNRICDDTREGLLCGQCKGDWGVGLLSNLCREYQYAFAQAYLLVPIYLTLLVVGLVLIVRLGIHLPTIFRGFLFYIQVSSVAVAYLPVTFRLRADVMDCIWSATALYVPYDFSFHANLTSLESYGLRYLTPLIALVVVPIAARAGRSSHSKYWHGVWTIIVLMYTRAVDTSISLLHCPTLHGQLSTGELDIITPWFFDGSVQCFQGAHIFLTIVSLAMLLFLIALIPLTALIIYHRKIKRTGSSLERVEKLSVAITTGFKDECKWWPVVELTSRLIFITVVLVIPGLTFVPLILSLVYLVLLITVLPYKNKWANAAGIFVLFWLVALLALGNTTPVIIASKDLDHFTLWPLFFLPVAIGAVVFVVKMAYQLGNWCKARRRSVKRRIRNSAANQQSRLQKFTSSFSLRSNLSTGKPRNVTMTTVSFDDVEDEYEFVEQAATSVTRVDNTIDN